MRGEITAGDLLTGLVIAVTLALPSLALLNHLLQEITRQQRIIRSNREDRAEARLKAEQARAPGILAEPEEIDHGQLADTLRQREHYQSALLDNFPFMVWLKDEQSRFLAVNQAYATETGWPSKQSLIGRNDLDIWPPDLAETYRADDRAVLESGQPKHVEELIEVEGRRLWYRDL